MAMGIPPHITSVLLRGSAALLAVLCTVLLGTCSPPQGHFQEILTRGTLRVVTINGPTTYYMAGQGPTGFEYDVAKRFAEDLGVKLRILSAFNRIKALHMLSSGNADIAAAGIATTAQPAESIRFTPPLRTISSELVYRRGEHKPSDLGDLGGKLVVEAGQSATPVLEHKSARNPDFTWKATSKSDSQELLHKVARGELPYTIANSDLLAIDQHYYPRLESAFTVGEPVKLAWALRAGPDHSLYRRTESFIQRLKKSHTLKQLINRYFGYLDEINYVGSLTFARDAQRRLPRYKKLFIRAAKKAGLDWRLLAAQAYQESHWRPGATSPTGVRGLMMLTMKTAHELGISNRLDPWSSISGGAKYLRGQINRLPASIKKPDRYWMALAAYNVGFGHLMDARRIARRQGGNPNRWIDVRKYIRLLTQPKWYKQARYGYAPGYQTLDYVANIRSYYDILMWMTRSPNKAKDQQTPPGKERKEKRKKHNKALDINPPVL